MYTQQDLDEVQSQLKRRWCLLGIPVAVLLAYQIFTIVQRNQFATILSGVLIIAFCVFTLELLVLPVQRYRRFLYEMLHGPRHEIDGTYASTDSELSVIDSIPYQSLHMTCLDEQGEPYDRLFYLDAEKELPSMLEGQHVHIIYHDRQIADLQPIG